MHFKSIWNTKHNLALLYVWDGYQEDQNWFWQEDKIVEASNWRHMHQKRNSNERCYHKTQLKWTRFSFQMDQYWFHSRGLWIESSYFSMIDHLSQVVELLHLHSCQSSCLGNSALVTSFTPYQILLQLMKKAWKTCASLCSMKQQSCILNQALASLLHRPVGGSLPKYESGILEQAKWQSCHVVVKGIKFPF